MLMRSPNLKCLLLTTTDWHCNLPDATMRPHYFADVFCSFSLSLSSIRRRVLQGLRRRFFLISFQSDPAIELPLRDRAFSLHLSLSAFAKPVSLIKPPVEP